MHPTRLTVGQHSSPEGGSGLSAAPAGTPLDNDSATLLILNRFTYGPRPGDLERLRAVGLKEWFRQQLNPQTVDDSALEARLVAFPAMQLPLDRLMELYPTNQENRASMNGRVAIPGGDAAHAIYKDQQQQYLDKKADKAKTDDHGDGVAPLPESPADILTLPPDRRFKLICHLTLPQFKNLRQSLSPEDRQRLTDGFTPQRAEAIAAFTVSGAAAMTPEEKDAVLEARLLHVPVSARTEQLIVAQTSADQQKQIGELRQVSAVGKGQDPLTMRGPVAGKQDFKAMDTQAAVAAGLIIGSPEFQRR